MKKILVTGAKGQLGKKIIDLLSKNFNLVLTDSDTMDITNIDIVREVVEREKPEFIIHAAAYTAVDKAEDNVAICRSVNSLGTKNIATIADKLNIKLIYISTDFVFDGSKKTPYGENDKTRPLSIYGLTKFEGEEFIREICKEHYIIRVAWLFGELPDGHPGTNFVETMLRLSKERESLSVVSDQIGSPTYTEDLVRAIETILIKEPEFGTYHFSGVGACSWYDFAKEIFKQTNTVIDLKPISSEQYPQKAKRPSYSYMDKSKIEKELNFTIRHWKFMLAEYINKR